MNYLQISNLKLCPISRRSETRWNSNPRCTAVVSRLNENPARWQYFRWSRGFRRTDFLKVIGLVYRCCVIKRNCGLLCNPRQRRAVRCELGVGRGCVISAAPPSDALAPQSRLTHIIYNCLCTPNIKALHFNLSEKVLKVNITLWGSRCGGSLSLGPHFRL